MTAGYRIRDQSASHFITTTVVDWIDVFTKKQYRDYIIESLEYSIENKGLVVFAYVIMSNHIHLIVQAQENNLSDLIRDFKKFTSKKILKAIEDSNESRKEWMLERFSKAAKSHSRNKNYQFWKYGNHPEEILTVDFLWTKIDYIHLNPVRVGIVERAEEYIYSSASNFMQEKGILKCVELPDNPVRDPLKPSTFEKYLRM